MDISSIYEVDSADWAENLRGSKRENTRQSSLFGARRISSLWEVTVKVTLKMGVKDPTHPNTELLFTRYVFWDHLLNHASKILYFHCMITDLITELALNKACAVFFVFLYFILSLSRPITLLLVLLFLFLLASSARLTSDIFTFFIDWYIYYIYIMYYHDVRVGSRVDFGEIQPRPHTHIMIQSIKDRNIKGLTSRRGKLFF